MLGFTNDPHGTIAVVFSMIPLTSPIVMLMRIPFGVPLWQIAISVTLLFGSFFVSFGLLQSVPNWDGKKPLE
jgi:ABC-type Na+ efflux pump permease subunit